MRKLIPVLMVLFTVLLAFGGCKDEIAVEEAVPFLVNYESEFGTVPDPIDVLDGTALTAAQLPELVEPGYTFKGWFDDTKLARAGRYKVSKEVTLVAKWEIQEYKLIFNLNQGEWVNPDAMVFKYTVETVQKYQFPKAEAVFKKDHRFVGWFTDELLTEGPIVSLNPELLKDQKFYAKWEKLDTVSSVLITPNGGELDYGDEISLSTETIDANIFYSINGASELPYTAPIQLENDMFLKCFATKEGMLESHISEASFTLKTYTVTFDNNGHGIKPKPLTNFKKGSLLTSAKLPILTDNDYSFEGWLLNGEPFNADTYEIGSDITLTAKWELIPTVASVQFSPSAGAIDFKDTITLTCATPSANIYYTINGENPNTNGILYNKEIVVETNLTLKAIAKKEGYKDSSLSTSSFTLKTYTVTFDNNGHGIKPKTITGIKKGDTLSTSQLDIESKGYQFEGWYDNGRAFKANETSINGNIQLIAKWKPISYTITYLGVNGASNPNANIQSYTIEDEISLAPPTKNGYKGKWFLDGKLVISIPKGTIGNIVLKAEWITSDYTINYQLNGGAFLAEENVPKSFTVETAQYIPLPNKDELSKKGCSFEGWYITSDFSGARITRLSQVEAKDITFYAKWVKKESLSISIKKVGTQNITINGVNEISQIKTFDIVEFGSYPQSVKAANVQLTGESKIINGWSCVKGNDENWYTKIIASPHRLDPFFGLDGMGDKIASGVEYYFKIEPIRWRVLTNDFLGKGKLLLSEKILISSVYYDSSLDRTIGKDKIAANNYLHSRVRAYLNGLPYMLDATSNSEFVGKGFINEAFGKSEREAVIPVWVDNSLLSTQDVENSNISANTEDSVFLLSVKEINEAEYGLDASHRVKLTTDFARANGAWVNDDTNYSQIGAGWWWLRSPASVDRNLAYCVDCAGFAADNCYSYVDDKESGYSIVPALVLDSSVEIVSKK